ncbi:MAG: DNA-directed RNA polymerase subunit D [Theionarchaea archaeon]|nr:DNA-directed RNA polymerase subunit D [Theionarchaea archaeon]MBU7036345.1 DNA-directed RNA polymerase subunit D [Theionarchaea archaeon]
MELRVLHRGEDKIRFVVEGVNAAFVNALRRTFISGIPTFAIDYVVFYSNISPLFDEIIAHRLGMVPLTTETTRYIPRDQCCQDGCEKCSVTLSLSKEGPCTVMSGDLISEDSDVVPVYENIPLVKLGPDQKLTLNAIARIGYARHHAKWQAALASFQHVARISVDTDMCDLGGACIRECPRGVLDIMGDELVPKYLYNCTLCKACTDVCDFDAIKVEPLDDSFIFTLESYGNVPVEVLVQEVVRIFNGKADSLLEETEKL